MRGPGAGRGPPAPPKFGKPPYARKRGAAIVSGRVKRTDRDKVADVIESNTQRVTLDELALRGKRFVRVISGTKALELVEAIVDATIARRAGELADLDRNRIVAEVDEQFRRVSRIQSEAEALLAHQKEMLAQQAARVADLEGRLQRAEGSLQRRERRLANARQTILNYDGEIERLAAQVRADAKVIDGLREALHERAEEAKRLQEALLEAPRGGGEGLEQLQAQLAELKEALRAREEAGAEELQRRFRASLEETLDKVSRTMQSVTARPLDRPVEATDALISRVFDRAAEMDTNLERLDLEASTTRADILKSLSRLKRLREEIPEAES